MDGDLNNTKNTQETTQAEDQPNSPPVVKKSREETIEELTQFFDNLFDPNNIVNNIYLIQRAVNEYFEISMKHIFLERNVKKITFDKGIICEAIEKNSNVIAHKKDNKILSITLKNFKLQKKIVVKNITSDKLEPFKLFVASLDETANEKITNWNFNYQLNLVSIVCIDEASAAQLYEKISTSKFEEAPIECSLSSESLYISGMENLKKKAYSFKNMGTPSMFPMGNMNMMQMYPYNGYMNFNPYTMNAFYGNGNYNNNYYAANNYQNNQVAGNDSKPVYPPRQKGGYEKKHYNQSYKNDRKDFSKHIKQPRDNNYKNSNIKQKQRAHNFVVRENDFPPL